MALTNDLVLPGRRCDDDTRQSRRVVIVDDHRMFLESVMHVIDAQADLEVVGTGATLAEARRNLASWQPDVVLLDCQLPDGEAVEHIAELSGLVPTARIVVLTSRENPRVARDALTQGADAFLTKTAALGDVLAVLRGRPVRRPSSHLLPQQVQPLSTREEQVLDMMAEGLTNPAIAERLGLSAHTVRNHVAAVSTKLGAHSKLDAVSKARRLGLLS